MYSNLFTWHLEKFFKNSSQIMSLLCSKFSNSLPFQNKYQCIHNGLNNIKWSDRACATSLISYASILLAHCTQAMLASLLFIIHQEHQTCFYMLLCPELCSCCFFFLTWDSSSLDIHMAYSFNFFRSLLKDTFSMRLSLMTLRKIMTKLSRNFYLSGLY